MHKEAARHTKRRTTRGQPANRAAPHQNRDRPANRKARNRNRGWPATHHRFRRARQAANRRHASEAKTTRYRGASRGPTPGWWFPLCTRTIKRCRCPACTARTSSSKRAAWMQRGSKSRFPSSSKGSSTRAALFRNDTRSTTFSRRTARLRRAKTAASKSSSRPGKNANEPQPKRRQEGHDKGPDYPHERRARQPIGDKSEKCATTNVATTANSRPHDGRRAYQSQKDLLNARSV